MVRLDFLRRTKSQAYIHRIEPRSSGVQRFAERSSPRGTRCCVRGSNVSQDTPFPNPRLRYFTKDGQHGVCIFRRRKSTEAGHRGFRLTSFGILLAQSRRPRPWRHVAALKELTSSIYSRLESSSQLQPSGSDWDPAAAFFEARKIRRPDLGGAGDWSGWINELEVVRASYYSSVMLFLQLQRRKRRVLAD
jgi:hypothetical protein